MDQCGFTSFVDRNPSKCKIRIMPRVGNPKHRQPHFVRAWREYRGLTGQQLADLLDTTKANISRIENLRQGYTQDFLEACAKVLRTTPAALTAIDPNIMPPTKGGRSR
jgi:hypothetical protein